MAHQGNEETESMGLSIFVRATFRAEGKSCWRYVKETLDHLLVKARFEETELKELPKTQLSWRESAPARKPTSSENADSSKAKHVRDETREQQAHPINQR